MVKLSLNKLLLILSFTLGLTTAAFAQKFDPDVKFKDLGSVAVNILDHASGGCWTNMLEAKRYAKGQLDIIGAKVIDDPSQAAVFLDVQVLADRAHDRSMCYGEMEVRVIRFDKFKGVKTVIIFSSLTKIALVPDNFNIYILDLVKEAVAEWK